MQSIKMQVSKAFHDAALQARARVRIFITTMLDFLASRTNRRRACLYNEQHVAGGDFLADSSAKRPRWAC